jgi:hypothetical protein
MKNPRSSEAGAFPVPCTDTLTSSVNATIAPFPANEFVRRYPIIAVHWLGLPPSPGQKEAVR